MRLSPEIQIVETPAEIFQAGAEEFARLAEIAIRERGRFTVALSGGSTPKGLYSLLATNALPISWEKIVFFWGDERHVPPTDPESNYRMANDAMLSKVAVEPQNVLRILSEEKVAAIAAEKYEKVLVSFFGLSEGDFPVFDLILLGIGPDGHTASLFPGSSALNETERLVVSNWVEKFKAYRITFTLPVINRAADVMFLVSGQEKAAVVQQILEGPAGQFPSQLVRPDNGRLIWLMDRGAAGELSIKA